jgi:aminoglycoside phosphotransferase (APT) family kinase protein
MRVRYDELPHMPRAATDRALDLLLRLAEHPEIFRKAFERSPETLLHGDYHRGNLLARDGEAQVAFDWQFACAGPPAYDLAVFWLYLGAITKPGLFRMIDRSEVRERSLTWQQVTDAYGAALRDLRPDVDLEALFACEDAAIAWEAVRQATYFGHGMEPFMGVVRFVYRDHRTIGGWFASWLGLDQGGQIFADLFADFEMRAERLLAAHGVPLP